MNIETATMNVPWLDARTSYRAYRQALKENRATREDKMLYRGLRALLRGQKVIDINLAIGSAGLDSHGRPKLAVCRADAQIGHCHIYGDGVRFTTSAWVMGRRPRGEIRVPLNAFAPPPSAVHLGSHHQAALPLIPPQFRPTGDYADYHLLWEAEWLPRPPVDPMLLKHVDGPFFVVLAAWNLTPLEQAVLRLRL